MTASEMPRPFIRDIIPNSLREVSCIVVCAELERDDIWKGGYDWMIYHTIEEEDEVCTGLVYIRILEFDS